MHALHFIYLIYVPVQALPASQPTKETFQSLYATFIAKQTARPSSSIETAGNTIAHAAKAIGTWMAPDDDEVSQCPTSSGNGRPFNGMGASVPDEGGAESSPTVKIPHKETMGPPPPPPIWAAANRRLSHQQANVDSHLAGPSTNNSRIQGEPTTARRYKIRNYGLMNDVFLAL